MAEQQRRDRNTDRDGATAEHRGSQTDDRPHEQRPIGRQDADDRRYASDDDRSRNQRGKRDSRRSK
jgi:hypothetical protein